MPVSHFTLTVTPAQLQAAKAFYLAALAPLGYKEFELHAGPNFVGFADARNIPDFFISAKEDAAPTKDGHFAFLAPDRESVHKFYDAAL
jgi:hypothetical protein